MPPSSEQRFQELLAYVPRRLCEARDEGTVTVLCPRSSLAWLQRLLPARKRFVAVRLDDLGSQVWHLVDGQRSVGQIGDTLAARAGLAQADCRQRTLIHLLALRARGAIALREP